MTSDNPRPDRCAAETRDGGYCENYPVHGAERCRMHGGTQPTGADSPNFEHGAYSKHFRSDLTEREQEAFDDLVDELGDEQTAINVVQQLAAEATLKYKRSGDTRFLREVRQLMSEFNLADATDHVEVGGEGFTISINHHASEEILDEDAPEQTAAEGGGDGAGE